MSRSVSNLERDADPAPMQVGYACGCVRPMQQRLGTPGHCPTHGAPIRKCGIAFEGGAEESWTELVRLRAELTALRNAEHRAAVFEASAEAAWAECRAKDAVILGLSERLACLAAHLGRLAERAAAKQLPLAP